MNNLNDKKPDDDLYTCDNCGARVDPNRNICLKCGTINNPIEKMLAKKMMYKGNTYSTIMIESPSFTGMDDNGEFNEGLHLLEKMKLKEAINYYNNALESNPNKIELWNNLGVALKGLLNRREALKCYEKTLEINPNYYIGLYNKGAIFFETKNYKNAIEYYNKALEINPKCAEAYQDRTIAYENLGELRLGDSFEASKMGLNIGRAMMNKGSALVDLGNGNDAIIGTFKHIYKDEKQVASLFEKGQYLSREGRINEALNVFNEALKINPQHPVIWLGKGGALLQSNDIYEGLNCLNQAINLDRNLVFAWLLKAGVLSMQSRFKEAADCIDEVLRIDPFHEQANQMRQKLKSEFKDNVNLGASKPLEKSMKIPNTRYEAKVKEGDEFGRDGKYHEAIKSYEEAIELDPNNAGAWDAKGSILVQLENFDMALECFNKALELNPQLELAWNGKGVALLKLRKFEEALTCFEKALEINPNSTMAKTSKLLLTKTLGIKSPPPSSIRFCTNCGNKIKAEQNFCGRCGTPKR